MVIYFDLETSGFTLIKPSHSNIIYGEELNGFKKLLCNDSCVMQKKCRESLLNSLLTFYAIHGHELKNLHSHIIIRSL